MRSRLTRSRLKALAAGALVLALPACNITACLDTSTWQESGTVVIADPPASVAPGETVTLDISGSKLGGGACIYSVTTLWSTDAAWARAWVNPNENTLGAKPPNCDTFTGTITTTAPADFAGGTLTVRMNEKAESTNLLFTTGVTTYAAKEVEVALSPPVNRAPTARVFAHYASMAAIAPESRLLDARLSSDPDGDALSYSWDVDGDGAYGGPGDAVEETATRGIVRVAAASLAGRGRVTIGVKATDPAGLSATGTSTQIELVDDGEWPARSQTVTLAPDTAAVGASIALTADPKTATDARACIDADGDGQQDDGTMTAETGWTTTLTAAGTGVRPVTVGFWPRDYASCAAVLDVAPPSAINVVTTTYAVAAGRSTRATATGYRARARLVLRGATMASLGTRDPLGAFTGTTARGTYAFATPARGNGATRPTALKLFRRGPYAIRTETLDFAGAASRRTVIGRATMLLRGSGGALACVAVTATRGGTSYAFIGGTGAAARLTGTATSTRIAVRQDAKPAKPRISFKRKRQRTAIRANTTIRAATATTVARIPVACAKLIPLLRG